jgi:excisionase family DNA binding protein
MTDAAATEIKAEPKHKPKARKPPAPLDAALCYNVPDAASVVGLSRATLFKMIKEGRLRSIFVAGRRLIPADALRALISVGA